MERATLTIGGMSCGRCVAAVDRALRGIDGVTVEGVEIGRAGVAYDPTRTAPEAIATVVREEGYDVVDVGRAP